jgi:restriction system protein
LPSLRQTRCERVTIWPLYLVARFAVGARRYGYGVRDDSAAVTTALQWLGLWVITTALLSLIGLLNKAAWVLAAVSAVAIVLCTWRALLAWLDHRRNARRDALYRATGQAAVDAMTGVEFEHYVAAVLRGVGYAVEFTRATGDFGVDLIATKDGTRTAVQCKRQSRVVNGSAIQQVVAGAAVHDCATTMVVSNHRYTRAAEQLAAVHGCVLVDRTRLARLSRAQSMNRSR